MLTQRGGIDIAVYALVSARGALDHSVSCVKLADLVFGVELFFGTQCQVAGLHLHCISIEAVVRGVYFLGHCKDQYCRQKQDRNHGPGRLPTADPQVFSIGSHLIPPFQSAISRDSRIVSGCCLPRLYH